MSIQTHGGDIYAFDRPILDFSASIDPLGAPESVIAAARDSLKNLDRYPDDKCRALTLALAQKEGVKPENILCGNGAEELIYAAMQALRPRRVLIVSPTFSEYERAALSVGAEIIKYTLDEKNGFCIEEDILNYTKQADMTFICDPNNPTGRLTDTKLLKEIIKNGNFTVTDRSFESFANCEKINFSKNMLLIKSFTKIYAIPALRLGYAVGSVETINKINNAKPRWSVSIPAQAAGLAALSETDFVEKSLKYIKTEKEYIYDRFEILGIKYFRSDVNFILFKTDIPLYEKMLEKNILIRDCTSFGLNGFYRIAVKTHRENERFFEALNKVIK